MSQAAHKLPEEGAVREARRPFSSFIRRLFSGPEEEVYSADSGSTKEVPLPDEQPEEFWNPKQGAPLTEAVRPMRPQFPVWKKEIPGLTDPFVDVDEWQDSWMQERQRRPAADRDGGVYDHVDSPSYQGHVSQTQRPRAQNDRISPLSVVQRPTQQPLQQQAEPVATMEQHPERQENLDAVVDRLLRDKDFLLAEELKHKAEEINQLLVQAQRQKMKVELEVSTLESRPGNKVSWLDLKIFKEI